MAKATYTFTVGGEDTPDLDAAQAARLAERAHRCGQPWMVHDAEGRCVDRGHGHGHARLDVAAAERYDATLRELSQ